MDDYAKFSTKETAVLMQSIREDKNLKNKIINGMLPEINPNGFSSPITALACMLKAFLEANVPTSVHYVYRAMIYDCMRHINYEEVAVAILDEYYGF